MRARIKPYNLQLGHLTKSVTLMQLQGASFEAGRWYDLGALAQALRVPEQQVIDVLESLRQDSINRAGPKVFDVATEEEAAAIDRGELRAVAGVGTEASKPEVPKVDPEASVPKVERTSAGPANSPQPHQRPQPGRNRPGGR